MNDKLRILIYIVIIIICISSIGIGVYDQFGVDKSSKKPDSNINITGKKKDDEPLKTQDELKDEFAMIFDNELHSGNYNTSSIPRMDEGQNIVYTYELTQRENNYEFYLNIPVININNEVANKFNQNTEEVFVGKANEIKNNNEKSIYDISYTGYINGNILSVVIESKLKEANNAQRIIVQTYNYNLKTGKEATIDDVIEQRGIDKEELEKKMKKQIEEAVKEANAIQLTGYQVFSRNINSNMYKIDNASTFFLGNDGSLFIIYAYGNNSYTSEMDIILI